MGDTILELEARRRVYDAVCASPGIHISQAAREAGIVPNHARYHLSQLVRARMLIEESDSGFMRYYPVAQTRGMQHNVLGRHEKNLIQALRRPRALHIAAALAVHGPLPLARLAAEVGKSRPAVLFHLNRLVEQSVVTRHGEAPADRLYALTNTEEVVRLLTLYPPRPGVVASFIGLWEGLAIPMSRPPSGPGGQEPRLPSDPSPAKGDDRKPMGPARLIGWLPGFSARLYNSLGCLSRVARRA